MALLLVVAAWPASGQPASGQPASVSAEIWFDDLIDAQPLAEPAVEDLTRYLADRALGSEPASGLPASLAEDRAPRMVFLSLSDGSTLARVLRASGRGVGAAVAALDAGLQKLRADGFTPRVIKVDLVGEVHRLDGINPVRPLRRDRSLYGLAFEREVDLAFLAEELVAHTLVNKDQKLRLRNIRKHGRAVGAQAALQELDRAETLSFYRFTAASYFSDGDQVAALYRGHRSFSHLEPEELLRHAELAGQYLARAVEASGRFVYAYLPKTDEESSKYNALRHSGTIYSMLELYQVTGDPALLEAAERALGYLERELLSRCQAGGVETACVVERGAVKLGGNALAMIALAQHAAVTAGQKEGEETWRPVGGHQRLIDDLGRWLLAVQADDGEFTIHKQAQPGGEIFDFVSQYYPGEALLALSRRPEPSAAWFDAAERGARWLIEVRDRDLPIQALNHDHWLLYALNEIYRERPQEIFLKHASRITQAILGRQRRPPAAGYGETRDWMGSYYNPPRSTPTATRSEGLGAAYLMLRDVGRLDEAAAILGALKLGVGFQLQTQFLPESVFYLRNPARALGGFRRSLTHYEVRIDYVQHNISALLLLRKILLEQAAAPDAGSG